MIPCMQGSLAGPIRPARYLLLALSGQQKIENLDKKVTILAENASEIAMCVSPAWQIYTRHWYLLKENKTGVYMKENMIESVKKHPS